MTDNPEATPVEVEPFEIQILRRGRPPVNLTPEEVTEKAIAYFQQCIAEKRKPAITGLALALGYMSRQSLIDAANARDGYLSDAINTAKALVELSYEEQLRTKLSLGAIFALKNFGWKDRQEIDLNRNGDLALRLQRGRKRVGIA